MENSDDLFKKYSPALDYCYEKSYQDNKGFYVYDKTINSKKLAGSVFTATVVFSVMIGILLFCVSLSSEDPLVSLIGSGILLFFVFFVLFGGIYVFAYILEVASPGYRKYFTQSELDDLLNKYKSRNNNSIDNQVVDESKNNRVDVKENSQLNKTVNITEEILKYKELLDKKAITEDEYNKIKEKLLEKTGI